MTCAIGTQSAETHYAYSPMNFAHRAFALALTYQALGKPNQAREVSKTVVHDAIETNNADVLKIARAFEVELALRQGHLTMASQWLEKYHTKPFVVPFRFYTPQLTAVKILLAQNTTASRRQAAELLDQLSEYLELIHNNRFQIDALGPSRRCSIMRWERNQRLWSYCPGRLTWQNRAVSYAFSWTWGPKWPICSND